MTKKQLYFIIAILIASVVGLLFIPSDTNAPTITTEEADKTTARTQSEQPPPESAATAGAEEVEPEMIRVDGVFIGLQDSVMKDRRFFQYLLLDDGTEIMRVDLRPLLGYKNTDVEAALGVSRGDRVQMEGRLDADGFKITNITKVE